MQPQVARRVDSYALDHEGEFHSASISFSIHVLGFVSEREGTFLGALLVWKRSEGVGWEGSYTSSRMCCVPCDESRGVRGLRRARDPFSLFSTKPIMQHEAVLVPPGFKPLSGCPLLLG